LDKNVEITILPENIRVKVPQGTDLMTAAHKAGVPLQSTCGGHGTCGECGIIVTDDADADGGAYVLACQCCAEKDMEIEIPASSRLSKHQVLLGDDEKPQSSKTSYFNKHRIEPICRKIFIRVPQGEIDNSQSDMERLKWALAKEVALTDVTIALDALRELPNCIRERDGELSLTVIQAPDVCEIIRVESGRSAKTVYGLSIDIGTTTVVVNLVDMRTGKIIGTSGKYNQQAAYGSDVISRIIHTDENPEGLHQLEEAVILTVNELIDGMVERHGVPASDIGGIVFAGNTVMSHMLLRLSAKYLRLEPYVPAAIHYPSLRAKQLGLNVWPDALVFVMPSVASYVGGDITSGVLAINLQESDNLTLFIDIGTNGEMVFGSKDYMVTCSCSAGPAFEGSGISCGMRAMNGAIDKVWFDGHGDVAEVKFSVIGGGKPSGVCGSGLISGLAAMRKAGIIDRAGNLISNGSSLYRIGLDGPEYLLCSKVDAADEADIVLTSGDIKNLLRAKGAIFAGIRTMLHMLDLEMDVIEQVYIGGGFGNFLNIEDAIEIGLLPELPLERYEYVGNSSVQGAMIALLSREGVEEAGRIASMMTYLELSIGNVFMDEFIQSIFIPHTDLGLFPNVERRQGEVLNGN